MADNFLSRLSGLMLAPPLHPHYGMLLTDCCSVHTCFMRQPLDLLYLDAQGSVTRCVANLRPWRTSSWRGKDAAGKAYTRATHVLELAAGTIGLLGIRIGDRLRHAAFSSDDPTRETTGLRTRSTDQSYSAKAETVRVVGRQKGSAMIEFAVVAPIITLLGLATLQYGLIFFAKNQYNHAAFMAARAGSVENANLDSITEAYTRALVPLYGGGTSAAALAASYLKAKQAVAGNTEIVMLNPTAESFADFNDPALQKKLGLVEQRVIPNGGLAFKKVAIVQANSGQNVQDANLLKLRITHGYAPQVPLVGSLYRRYLQWLDPGTSAFHTQSIKNGLIPMVSNVTMQMQSDAIEGATVSTPGPGNQGVATNAGNPPRTQNPPPACTSVSCGNPVGEGESIGGPVLPEPEVVGPAAPVPPAPGGSEPVILEPGGLEPGDTGNGTTTPGGPCTLAGSAV
ncbi:MAG: DUF192 domain-containing protein [Pseudomonadota bacterium]